MRPPHPDAPFIKADMAKAAGTFPGGLLLGGHVSAFAFNGATAASSPPAVHHNFTAGYFTGAKW
jgi:hypothetical protein